MTVALAIAGCARDRAQSDVALAIADAANNAGASVAAAGDRVVVTWAATAADRTNVYAAVSHDGGRTFDRPVRVNDIDGDARLSGDQAPRVAIGDDLVVAWVSRLGGQSRVRLARSKDGGRTFLPATTPHADGLTGARGWTSLAIDNAQVVHTVWLDGRDAHTGITPANAEHHMRQDIFQSLVQPDGTRVEARVATNVCFCCKTAVAATGSGTTFVAWRHVYPTNVRDIAVARSTDGGRTFSEPVRVSEDHWQIDACPEDGPSIAVTPDGALHVTWPTMIEAPTSRKAIFYTFSTDGGRTFAPRVRIDRDDDGSLVPSHPQIAVVDSSVSIVWDESTGSGRRVRLQHVSAPQGTERWQPSHDTARTISRGDGNSAYPAIATSSAGVVVAWTAGGQDTSSISVRVIPR